MNKRWFIYLFSEKYTIGLLYFTMYFRRWELKASACLLSLSWEYVHDGMLQGPLLKLSTVGEERQLTKEGG